MKILKTLAIIPAVFAFVAVAQAAPKSIGISLDNKNDTVSATIDRKDDCRCLTLNIDFSKCEHKSRASACCKVTTTSTCGCEKELALVEWSGEKCTKTTVVGSDINLKFFPAQDENGNKPWETQLGDRGQVKIAFLGDHDRLNGDVDGKVNIECKLDKGRDDNSKK